MIELNQGNDQFSQAGSGGLVPRNTPLVADFTATVCLTSPSSTERVKSFFDKGCRTSRETSTRRSQ